MYTTSTYKPLAFYPNKKPKTDQSADQWQRRIAGSSFSSTELPLATSDRNSNIPAPRRAELPHRASLQCPINEQQVSPDSLLFRDSHLSPARIRHQADYRPQQLFHQDQLPDSHPKSHYQTPENTPTASTFGRTYDVAGRRVELLAEPTVPVLRDSRRAEGYQAESRRSSVNRYRDFGSAPAEQQYEQQYPVRHYVEDGRYTGRYRDEHALPLGEQDPPSFSPGRIPPTSGYGHAQYQNGQPPFFMPSHYEYQHGKARKRSNLPKQSTEIMKTWFDQVRCTTDCRVHVKLMWSLEHHKSLPKRGAKGTVFKRLYHRNFDRRS